MTGDRGNKCFLCTAASYMKLAPPREYSAAQRYPAPKGGRQSHICPFRRGSPGSLPLWHVMPWSLHFVFRGGPEKVAKKRGRRPGEKSLSPGRRTTHSGSYLSHPFRQSYKKNHPPASAPSEHLPSNTGAAPRPFRWRPARREKFSRDAVKPERLSERPQGASCAEVGGAGKF